MGVVTGVTRAGKTFRPVGTERSIVKRVFREKRDKEERGDSVNDGAQLGWGHGES